MLIAYIKKAAARAPGATNDAVKGLPWVTFRASMTISLFTIPGITHDKSGNSNETKWEVEDLRLEQNACRNASVSGRERLALAILSSVLHGRVSEVLGCREKAFGRCRRIGASAYAGRRA